MKKKSKKGLINRFIFLLFLIALFLGFKINEKKEWIQLPPLSSWFPYERWFNYSDSTISSSIQYHHLIDNYYTNGSNSCISLFDGIVLDISDSTITVLHDNGVQIIYGEIIGHAVKVDERILKGNTIGSIHESLTLDMTLNNEKVTLEDVMKL